MPSSRSRRPGYKEITLQQLRSLCESVRLGSFTAAGNALGISHPTVLGQVHALERLLGARLVETHARGCRPTPAGTLLAEIAAPAVAGISSVERNFQEARAEEEIRLVVAGTPRIHVEDLPMCVVEFSRRWPNVHLTILEMRMEEVPQAVEAGEAHVGLTSTGDPDPGNAWVSFEPAYELDVVLITPKDHPLARRRRVSARDLGDYALVNAPPGILDPSVSIALQMLGAFRTGPRRVEASYAAAIRRYVELGFGIGVVLHVPSQEPDPKFHERSLSRELGQVTIHLVWRKGALQPPHARAFAECVKKVLKKKSAKSKKK